MRDFIPLVLLVILMGYAHGKKKFEPSNSLVWGPGLDAELVVPIRYFFVQAVDTKGRNMTDSVGVIDVRLYTATSGGQIPVRARPGVLDRNDGTYIIRYRLRETVKDITIEVLHKGRQIGKSPYKLPGMLYYEFCPCPEPDFEKWMEKMGCPASYPQIERDLSRFNGTFDMKYIRKEALKRYPNSNIIHFVVKDNEVHLQRHGRLTDFKMYMENFLLSMTRKVHMPDFEFFINLGDWPMVKPIEGVDPLPILAWCNSEEHLDIVLPTYDVTRSTLEGLDRVSLDLLAVQGNTGPKWKDKTPLGFFRGRDSNKIRLDLVRMSIANPHLLDAKLNVMAHFKNEKGLGETVKRISFYDFFKYKYQVSVDGTVAAYRLPYLFGGDALIFKQDSTYYEFFYKDLVPFQHYIPIKNDLSDLLEKLQWAMDNDKEAQGIAKNGRKFMQENLLPTHLYCYHAVFFKEWASRLASKPTVLKGMEYSDPNQDTNKNVKCDCQRPPIEKPKKKKANDEL